MSRLDGRFLVVETDSEGRPLSLLPRGDRIPIVVEGWASRWREWVGILDGEPERDIWHVLTARGACEPHHLRLPTVGDEKLLR